MSAAALLPASRPARAVALVALASLAAILAAYALVPPDPETRRRIADAAWTWAGLVATVATALAWRRAPDAARRRAWGWVAGGCALWLGGQLVWDYYDLVLGSAPPYPSLADIGYLAMYPAFLVAIAQFCRTQPRRRADPDLWLDAALVTFTGGAVSYVFLFEPLLATPGQLLPLVTSLAWATGSVAVLWMILFQMMRRTQFPFGSAGVVATGLATLSAANTVYAVQALRGTFVPGTATDLAWDAGLLVIAAAAAAAIDRTPPAEDRPPPPPTSLPRALALAVGVAGAAAIAAKGALSSQRELDVVVLTLIACTIIAARLVHAARADRRYAVTLEHEVAAQTRHLMESLAATAAAERHLRLLMESVPDAILLLDRQGRTVDRNTASGSSPGSSIFDALTPEAQRLARENLDAAFQGAVRRFEVPFEREGRKRGITSVLYAPVRESGGVTRVLALARDVTDVRRAEAQLQQAEKLAALGQLVSGVAHEINNPAAIISGFAQTLLLDDLRPDQRDTVKMIQDEAARIGRITTNLLAFARAGGRDRTLVDLNDIARRTYALRAYHLSTLNVAVTMALDPSDPKVWGNGSEFQQLVLNLLINAEQALTAAPGPHRAIMLRTSATDTLVRLECGDTGPGIPEAIRGKIFDPFFTTKPEGVGTGLGLSICYGIVEEHGGRIWVDTEVGGGARFTVELPRDPRSEARPEPASGLTAATAATAAPLRVLLVDDEAALRKAAARFLNRRGMRVRGAADGAAALRALRAEEFDVIVSDVRMPGMSGREFLEGLRRDYPAYVSRLIFSTGDTFAPDTAALLAEAGVPALVKPFDFGRLEELLRETAARPKTPPAD